MNTAGEKTVETLHPLGCSWDLAVWVLLTGWDGLGGCVYVLDKGRRSADDKENIHNRRNIYVQCNTGDEVRVIGEVNCHVRMQ